jgi:hypothetical protein
MKWRRRCRVRPGLLRSVPELDEREPVTIIRSAAETKRAAQADLRSRPALMWKPPLPPPPDGEAAA